jgi:DNA-binding CsgD family transcriptional regulator
MTEHTLPQRTARISDETQAEIVRLGIRQVSHAEIARRAGVHRHTVERVLKRTRSALRINEDTELERAAAIAVYREVQRTAWEAIESGRSPALLLGEVRQAQQRIDTLLGLAPGGPDDPIALLGTFKATVIRPGRCVVALQPLIDDPQGL